MERELDEYKQSMKEVGLIDAIVETLCNPIPFPVTPALTRNFL